MSAKVRRGALVGAAVSLAVGVAACGQAGEAGGSGGEGAGRGGLKVGLLFPENETARYEQFDRPLITQRVKQLCEDCTVDYANAHNDAAAQQQQVDTMITEGVDVLVLNSVDSRSLRSSVLEADRAGIPVLAYDRGVEGPISAMVTYGVEDIGRVQAEALLEALRARGDARIVRVEGPRTNEPTPFEAGGQPVLKGKLTVTETYRAASWNTEHAYTTMSGAIAALGTEGIDGVWAANDSVAGGVIAAMQNARIKPLPPVVGQDADLSAVQRIVAGQQYMSVYKPFKAEAYAAAELALALGRGEHPGELAKDRVSTPTTKDVPAVLLTPKSVTVHTVEDTVIKDDVYSTGQICTPKYRAACEKAGLVE